MTAQELKSFFNERFGIEEEWPKKFKVDADTYAQCCQFLINDYLKDKIQAIINMQGWIPGKNIIAAIILVGPNNGIMFKNVELILELTDE